MTAPREPQRHRPAGIEDLETRPVVVRTGGLGRRLPILVALVTIALALAIVKPWPGPREVAALAPEASDASAAAAGSPSTPVPATPTPSPQPTTPQLDPLAMPCMSVEEWRATTVERTAGEEIRRWLAVQPIAASGPTDPSIPTVQVVAGVVRGLGFCAPAETPIGGPPTIWIVSGTTATQVTQPESLQLLIPAGQGAAQLYRPPVGRSAWRAGRYVLRVPLISDRSDISSGGVYLAIELVDATHP